MRKRFVLGLILLVASPAAPCSGDSQAGATLDIAAQQTALVNGNTAFALDLYGELAAESGNIFFSPLSISTALALAYAGSSGETAAEMAAVLRFPADQRDLASAMSTLRKDLETAADAGSYQLRLANRLWAQKGLGLLPDFLAICQDEFGAGLATMDFAADPEGARAMINDWTAVQTEQKITDLLLPPDITSDTSLVLTNAVYFRGRWAQAFDPEWSQAAPFHLAAGGDITTTMMGQRGRFAYAAWPELEVLQLAYQGDTMALTILLPRAHDGLAALEAGLSTQQLAAWLTALRPQDLTIWLPRFNLNERLEVRDVLQSLGMVAAFTPVRADFSGMTGQRGLFISRVIHEAYLEVNEEGTEAAAATAVVMKRGPAPFRADRPFLFLIQDLRHDSIVFIGRLVHPRSVHPQPVDPRQD